MLYFIEKSQKFLKKSSFPQIRNHQEIYKKGTVKMLKLSTTPQTRVFQINDSSIFFFTKTRFLIYSSYLIIHIFTIVLVFLPNNTSFNNLI